MTEMHVGKLLTPLAIPERIWEELGERPVAGSAPVNHLAAVALGDAAGGSKAGAQDAPLAVPWDGRAPYDHLADLLLLALTRRLAAERGKLSLRGLAQAIGMSRSTLSGRLKALVHRNVVDLGDLSRLVGISEK
jgi:hypothetical protein